MRAEDLFNDIPEPALIDALIQQESGGNNSAVSPKGARGLAQIMPATAKKPGMGVSPLANDSPEEQRRFASDYMGALLKRYGGNEEHALAAYNAGMGAVDAHGGIPPYPETQNYVKKILSSLNPISSAQANETPYQEPAKKPKASDLFNDITEPQESSPKASELFNDSEKLKYHGRNVADMSGVSQFLTGTGNKILDLGRGAAQITGIAGDTGFGSQSDVAESRKLSDELGKSKSGMVGNIAGDVLPFMMTGGSTALPSLVAKSAAFGGMSPTLGGESRAKNAGYGAAGGLIGAGVNKAIGGTIKGFTPSDEASRLMAQGVQPTLGQGIKQDAVGRAVRKAEEGSIGTFLLGGITKSARDRASKEGSLLALKQAESDALGISAKGEIGHEAISNLKSSFNAAYTNALAGHSFGVKPALGKGIADAIDNARLINSAERRTLLNDVQSLFDKIKPDSNGKYLASDFHSLESILKADARGLAFGDPRIPVINDIKNVIMDYRKANIPAEAAKKVADIDKKYLNFTRLRQASQGVGAERGEFTPAQLYNAATMMGKKSGQASTGSAPMQKLAGELKTVMSSKTGDSGTASNTQVGNVLLGLGAGYNLPAALAVGGSMYAGSSRAVQKALLGGYNIQHKLSALSKKGDKSAASAGLLLPKQNKDK